MLKIFNVYNLMSLVSIQFLKRKSSFTRSPRVWVGPDRAGTVGGRLFQKWRGARQSLGGSALSPWALLVLWPGKWGPLPPPWEMVLWNVCIPPNLYAEALEASVAIFGDGTSKEVIQVK